MARHPNARPLLHVTDNTPLPLSDEELARFRAFCERNTDHHVKQMVPLDGNTLWRAKRGEPLRRPTRERILAALEADAGEVEVASMLRGWAWATVRSRAEALLIESGMPVVLARKRAPVVARFVLARSPS